MLDLRRQDWHFGLDGGDGNMQRERFDATAPFIKRRVGALFTLCGLMGVIVLSAVMAETAWPEPTNGATSFITIQARHGDLEAIDQAGNCFQVKDGDDITFEGAGPEFVRVRGCASPENPSCVEVLTETGITVENATLFSSETWFRDITFTGTNKIVVAGKSSNSVGLFAAARSVPSEDSPEEGDVFSGKCEISHVSQNGDEGSLNYVTCIIKTGILKELSPITAYCADHSAAAPYSGQDFTYTFTITYANKKTGEVRGTFYATSVSGATDGTTTDAEGRLTGYQRISVTAEIERKYTGYMRLKKVSSVPAMTSSNPMYSLDGATYRIYEDKACTKKAGYDDLVTKEGSYVKSEAIDAGTYYVKELKAPKGFEASTKAYKVEIEPDETTDIGVEMNGKTVVPETPLRNPSKFVLGKIDGDSAEGWAQGDASLQGAQYKMEYYAGQYSNAQAAQASGAPSREWVFASDANGKINMCDESYLISGTLFKDDDGDVLFPLGTYVIYETKASPGYLVSDEKVHVQIKKDPDTGNAVFAGNPVKGTAISGAGNTYTSYTNVFVVKEPPVKGSLKLEKRDLETGERSPTGGATLENTQFKVTNRSRAQVMVAGHAYQPGDVCATFYTNKDGIAQLAERALPYGTYEVKETAASEGYLLTDGKARSFAIRSDEELVFYGKDDEEGASRKGDAFYNQVMREDLSLVKVRGGTSEHLSDIPFEVVSNTTGERHVIVTDENGETRTEASWNPHTRNTNANDDASEDAFDRYAGVWWGLNSNGTTAPVKDDLCALPYGDYVLKELPTSKNQEFELVEFGFSINRDGKTVNLGTIENNSPSESQEPAISTVASDATDGDKLAYASSACRLNDQVSYMNLNPGKNYTLHATLLDVQTLQAVPGAETRMEFAPSSSFGSVVVEMECDTLYVAGREVVFFEELLLDEEVVCEHKDANDAAQKVAITKPEVETYAQDSHDGDKNVVADSESSVRDEVRLKNLEPNVSYTLYGIVMDGDNNLPAAVNESGRRGSPSKDEIQSFWTGLLELLGAKESVSESGYSCDIAYNSKVDKAAIERYLQDNQKVAAAIDIVSKEFSANSDAMNTSLDYSVPSGELEGNYVIFDLLLNDDTVVAVHADTANSDQSFEITRPQIATTALDKTDQDHNILPSKEAEVVDTIEYSGLVSGAEYEISGTLMDKGSGKALYVNDKLVEASKTFTPNSESGTVDVAFTFDASGLKEGAELVAFEYLRKDGRAIAEHADIKDKKQTVKVSVLSSGNPTLSGVVPGGGIYYKTGHIPKESNLALFALLSVAAIGYLTWRVRQRRYRYVR